MNIIEIVKSNKVEILKRGVILMGVVIGSVLVTKLLIGTGTSTEEDYGIENEDEDCEDLETEVE